MKKHNGFTLVELLVVIVVLALLIILAVPAIFNVVGDSRKQSFYIYTSKVYQQALNRYLADYNSATNGELACTVYRIPQDLDIPNSGNYVGWVKMERVAKDSGNVELTKSITNANGLYSVRYCTKYNSDCNPAAQDNDATFKSEYWEVPEDLQGNAGTTTMVKVTSKPGYHLCVQYQYPVGNTMVYSNIDCGYQSSMIQSDSFQYKMTLSMKDGNNAVENFVIYQDSDNNDIQNTDNQKKIFEAMGDYKNNHSNDIKSMVLNELTCSGNGGYISNDPNVSTTKVTTSNNNGGEVTTVVTNPSTTQPTTATIITQQPKTKANSVLLTNITIAGYNINFNPGHIDYSIQVPYSTQALSVSWTKANDGVEVEMSGANNLVVGSNLVVVHAYNLNTNEEIYYYITVSKLPNPYNPVVTQQRTTVTVTPSQGLPDPTLDSSNAKLSNILIGGYELSDVFSPDVYAYDVEVDDGAVELAVSPVLQEVSATYTITGNKEIKDGAVITIEVVSQNKYYHNTYTVTVHYKKSSNKSTVIIRAIVVFLGVILIILLFIIRKQKASQKLVDAKSLNEIEKGGYVDPTKINK